MKWKRVIGMGGFGVAVKYERIGLDGQIDNAVVKVDKKGDQDLFTHEWMWYKARWASSRIQTVGQVPGQGTDITPEIRGVGAHPSAD